MADTKITEEVTEMFCEFCYKDGKQSQLATGFCEECVTYFCTTCLKYHKKFYPNHTQQDKENMPNDFYTEHCRQHPEEKIKFFCQSCETIACLTCKLTHHTKCGAIHHLPKLVEEFEKEKELGCIATNLELAEKEMTEVELTIVNGKSKISQYKKDAKHALQTDRNEINDIFDQLEHDTDNIEAEDKLKIEIEEEKLGLLKANIKSLKSDMENSTDSLPKSKLFVVTKKAKLQSESILESLKNLKMFVKKFRICKYKYIPTNCSLWTGNSGKLKVISEKGKEKCVAFWSTALLLLSMILGSLLLNGTPETEVIKLNEIQLSYPAHQICHITNNSLLYIPSPQGKVYFINLEDDINEMTNIDNYNTYTAIGKVNDNHMFFLSTKGQVVNYIQLEESVQQRDKNRRTGSWEHRVDSYDINGNKLFGIKLDSEMINPFNIAISVNLSVMYVTDIDSVISFSRNGKVQGIYRHRDLYRPKGITTDSNGNLYVCGFLSNNIFKIMPDLTHGYELIGEAEGLDRPYSISYNEKEHILYVGLFTKKTIQAYKII